jgi:hypothetical protein
MIHIRTAKKVLAIQWLGNNSKEIFEYSSSGEIINIKGVEHKLSINPIYVAESENQIVIHKGIYEIRAKIGDWIVFEENDIFCYSQKYFEDNFLILSNK